jgi:hypothetical protein
VNAAVDFLPASYRARLAASRTRRERLWLAVPVIGALLATDAVLRQRVRIARDMANAATAHATRGEQRSDQTAQLAQRVAAARETLEQWVEPMAAPRMAAVVDDLLADRPPGMSLQVLSCRHDPWSRDPEPQVRIEATCPTPDAFTEYLGALRRQPSLPPMQCKRTYAGPESGIGFQLESVAAAPDGPR